ncbi:MAG TPA: redoxin domain-containing protein [Candidatus Methylomirabilis sp.]|nr:redoxin domain-containing protein [Candidatus Methylomirabilis sp.]
MRVGDAMRSRSGEGATAQRLAALTVALRCRAMVMAILAILLLVGPAAAAQLDDLLFDLQLVPLDGQLAPPFTLPGLDGAPVSLAQFRDRVVLLYFWATW